MYFFKKTDLFVLFSFCYSKDPEPNARDRTLTVTKKRNNHNIIIIIIITSLTKKNHFILEQYQHRALPTPITVHRYGTRRRPSRQSLRCLHWIYNDSTTLPYFNIFNIFFIFSVTNVNRMCQSVVVHSVESHYRCYRWIFCCLFRCWIRRTVVFQHNIERKKFWKIISVLHTGSHIRTFVIRRHCQNKSLSVPKMAKAWPDTTRAFAPGWKLILKNIFFCIWLTLIERYVNGSAVFGETEDGILSPPYVDVATNKVMYITMFLKLKFLFCFVLITFLFSKIVLLLRCLMQTISTNLLVFI